MDELQPAVILVIDDDWINRELMQTVLKRAGYAVQTCSTGERGLQVVAETPPDMVIVDLRLGDMNGLEVVERIRALPGRRLPIVVMSALEGDQVRQEALAAGSDLFISKIFAVNELIHQLSELLLSAP